MMLMMMIVAFGATNVPATTTKIILTITEIRETIKRRRRRTINALILPPLHQTRDDDDDDDDDCSLWSNECPCYHDKDYTKTITKIRETIKRRRRRRTINGRITINSSTASSKAAWTKLPSASLLWIHSLFWLRVVVLYTFWKSACKELTTSCECSTFFD